MQELKDTTMKCNEIRELLPDLAAGLSAPAAEVNEHVRGCAGCATTLDELRRTMALLDEWQAPEPSPEGTLARGSRQAAA